MFRKRCESCGKEIKSGWVFCPNCGERLKEEDSSTFSHESIFGDIEDEFKRIDKMFGSDFFGFPKFDTKIPKGSGGISVTITSGTGKEPKVDVKTSGNYKGLEPEIKRKLGVKPAIEEVEEEPKHKQAKVTEEPETKIDTIGNKQTIQIKLPNVKSLKDIEIKKLEQSLEIKAFAKDNTYFKLIPIHSNSEIINKEFKNNVLKIEIER